MTLSRILPGVLPGFLLLALGAGPSARAAGANADSEASRLVSPLEIAPRLTSSFGEYRAGHYHGGLDYSTGGATGLTVRAPASGWVYRLRASGVGYGKAVYFRLDDGRTAVFAHLSRFTPRLEAAIAEEQDRLARYEVDLYPSPGALRYARGEALALTGATGAGPPHLHAEIRVDPGANVAVDPRTAGWPVPDRIPPTLGRLLVEPARAGVLVNGGIDPVILQPGSGVTAGDTLFVTGPVRCWIEARDRTSPDSGVLAPRRIATFIDGIPWSRVSWERFDWRWPSEVEWTFLESAARASGERWVRLDPPPGTRQPVHTLVGDTRFLGGGLAPKPHRLRIVAEDHGGNTTEVVVPILAREMTSVPAPTEPGVDPTAAALPAVVSRGTYLELNGVEREFLHQGKDGLVVILQSEDGAGPVGGLPMTLDPVSLAHPDRYTTEGPLPDLSGVWTLTTRRGQWQPVARLSARTSGKAPRETILDLGPAILTVPRGAVYEDLWVVPMVGDRLADPGPNEPELDPVTPAVRLTPWAAPLRESIRVELPVPPGLSRRGLGIYSRSGSEWEYEGADSTGRGLSTRIGNLEELALFRDGVAPRMRFLVSGDGAVEPARPRLVTRIVETGSGVTWRTLTMELDGKVAIAEWDREAQNLTAVLREPLVPGEHRLRVIAFDRAGNRAELARTFTVADGN